MKSKINIYLILLDSINRIIEYTSNMQFEDFCDDYKTFDATITQLMHLGEITKKLVDTFGDEIKLPVKEMIGMRNFIAHEYLGISKKIIFEVVVNEIPKIKVTLELLISDLG